MSLLTYRTKLLKINVVQNATSFIMTDQMLGPLRITQDQLYVRRGKETYESIAPLTNETTKEILVQHLLDLQSQQPLTKVRRVLPTAGACSSADEAVRESENAMTSDSDHMMEVNRSIAVGQVETGSRNERLNEKRINLKMFKGRIDYHRRESHQTFAAGFPTSPGPARGRLPFSLPGRAPTRRGCGRAVHGRAVFRMRRSAS